MEKPVELHAYIGFQCQHAHCARVRMPCKASWLNRSAILPADTGLANQQNVP